MTLPSRDQAMIDAIGRVLVDEVDPLKRAIEKLVAVAIVQTANSYTGGSP